MDIRTETRTLIPVAAALSSRMFVAKCSLSLLLAKAVSGCFRVSLNDVTARSFSTEFLGSSRRYALEFLESGTAHVQKYCMRAFQTHV